MGHASIKMTADTSGHLVPEHHEAAVAKLDQYVAVAPAEGAVVTVKAGCSCGGGYVFARRRRTVRYRFTNESTTTLYE